MKEPRKVECNVHGLQDESFVCQHIVESLHTGKPVGFFWSRESSSLHPDAWCSSCEDARIEAGGDWNDEVLSILNIKLLCGACYDHAKKLWAQGQKVTQ